MIHFKRAAGLFIGLSFSLLMGITAHAATYNVVAGDTLYEIGKLFGTTPGTIMGSNSLSGTVIYPGQALNVASRVHTVRSGDTLYLVSEKYDVPLMSLRKANSEWDNYLFVGQKLNIPASTSGGNPEASQTTAKSTISYTTAELDLLARLVRAEAESEPYDAQVAVAAVVINRVRDSRFPDTLSSVIYQKSDGFYQFTPVENGWINKPATEQSRKAALAALNGSDPSNGAVFYFDDSTTNKWLWSKPITARIGKMVYVK